MFEAIISILKKSTSSNVFCTKVEVPSRALSLAVDTIGPVSFPISARTAKTLIVEAEPAKFGHHDKTVLDREIRDVWEISKNRVETDREWDQQLATVLQQVKQNLGLPDEGELTAELHNLLIYMPGQFFKAHQDSEKADGMLATLAVLLPSEFTGGELVIDQHGDRRIFSAPDSIDGKISYIAFYSDCHHEVKPVLTGYRVALTYNLFFKSAEEVFVGRKNEKLERELHDYFSGAKFPALKSYQATHPAWLVYLLDHQYTQKSLSWHSLRGADRERAREFIASAENLGLTAHLALADIHETWSTEDSWNDYRRYGRRRWSDEEDDEAIDESSESEGHELSELIEDTIELRYWINQNGRHLDRKSHAIPQSMVCWTKAMDEYKPFRSEYEGYMGNYGNTLDRWYHRAAIVLWKKDTEYASVFTSDSAEALKRLSSLLRNNFEKGIAALQQVLPLWPEHNVGSLDPIRVFEVADLVQNDKVATNLVHSLGLESLSAQSLSEFIKLLERYGESWGLDLLVIWKKQQRRFEVHFPKDLVLLMQKLSRPYSKISHLILEDQVTSLKNENESQENEYGARSINSRMKDRIKATATLLEAARAADEHEIHRNLIDYVLKHRRMYPTVEAARFLEHLQCASKKDEFERWGYSKLVVQLRKRFEEEFSFIRDKNDWSIKERVNHNCPDCLELSRFLASSTEKQFVWPIAKDRRQHIHSTIDEMDLPVTHETLRKGSPHKLVLTKTPALFHREKARAEAAEVELAKLKRFS